MVIIGKVNRSTRSDSLDSQSSTICVKTERSGKEFYPNVDIGNSDDLASALHRFCLVSSVGPSHEADGVGAEALRFDLAKKSDPPTARETVVRQALASIVVLDDDHQGRRDVRRLLEAYNGRLVDVNFCILESLRTAAPQKFAARVGDFNDNLFYEMQEVGRGIRSIVSGEDIEADSSLPNDEAGRLFEQIDELEDSLRSALGDASVSYTGSFMQTENTIYQPAHVDYDWNVLREQRGKLFVAFFPLTDEGSFVQLWKDGSGPGERPVVHGTVVYIPYGKMLIVPSATVHGGGFKCGDGGNLRFHLYLAIGGEELPRHQTNKYTEEHDRTRELSDRFLDSPGLDCLLGDFFDTC